AGLGTARAKRGNMNLNHAFGFLFIGTMFGLLPRFAPDLCPVTGVDGTSAREIWLQLMSALLIGVALVFCAQRLLSMLAVMMKYDPQPRLAMRTVRTPRRVPQMARVAMGEATPVPVAAFRRA